MSQTRNTGTLILVAPVESVPKPQVRGEACLVLLHPPGPDIGRRTPLARQSYIIGRDTDADLVISRSAVSRQHAQLARDEQGEWWAIDMGSTNGTFVNDEELTSRRKLKNGDFIKVGGVIFKYIDGDNIENLYYEEIYRMAIIDGLTQIFNKRYLLEFLDREIARCARYARPLALIMFDLDHFKRVNDDFGHLAGDYVLKRVADLIQKKHIRKEECFARYGGEEFAIVLPDTPSDRGVILAEKIRQLIEESRFEFESNVIPVTVSMGVSQMQKGDACESFIVRTDEKLYLSKQNGRNRVSSA